MPVRPDALSARSLRASAVLLRVAPEGAPATTVGDPAELLDVDVDQVAGRCGLVAERLGGADRQAGGLVEIGQQRHPVASQDTADGRSWDAEVVADPVWSPAPAVAELDDASLQSAGALTRRAAGREEQSVIGRPWR